MQVLSKLASGLPHFWIAAALLVFAVIGTWFWNSRRAEQELLELPTQDRQTFYEHTLETLRTVCVRANGPDLGGYCREQARFITRFPECDTSCRELSKRFAPQPTR